MTEENTQVLDQLSKDFLHSYVELAFRGTHDGAALRSGDGQSVRVVHTTTHKFGPGYSEIFKGDKIVCAFNAMRGCVVRNQQGLFIQTLKTVLE